MRPSLIPVSDEVFTVCSRRPKAVSVVDIKPTKYYAQVYFHCQKHVEGDKINIPSTHTLAISQRVEGGDLVLVFGIITSAGMGPACPSVSPSGHTWTRVHPSWRASIFTNGKVNNDLIIPFFKNVSPTIISGTIFSYTGPFHLVFNDIPGHRNCFSLHAFSFSILAK